MQIRNFSIFIILIFHQINTRKCLLFWFESRQRCPNAKGPVCGPALLSGNRGELRRENNRRVARHCGRWRTQPAGSDATRGSHPPPRAGTQVHHQPGGRLWVAHLHFPRLWALSQWRALWLSYHAGTSRMSCFFHNFIFIKLSALIQKVRYRTDLIFKTLKKLFIPQHWPCKGHTFLALRIRNPFL